MASGLGPNLILPGGRQLWGNLTGTTPWNGQPGQQDWFGLQDDPMQWNAALMDAGRRGQLMSRGPQSGTWTPPTEGSWNQISTPFGVNSALFGSSFNPAAGQGAYDRFNDVGASYLRRYGTDLTDAQGNVIGFGPERGAGARSMSTFGGRNAFNDPLTGQEYGGHREFAGLAALQQGANPFLNNPTLAAQMSQFQELGSPFARADPANYLATMLGAEGQYPTTGEVGGGYIDQAFDVGNVSVDDMRNMANRMYQGTTGDVHGTARDAYGRTVGDVQDLTNSYEQQLMQQMAAEGSKDLSLGLQDAQGTMAAMGLGRSGQGQSTAAGVWRDIQERNALDRQNLMAQFRQAGMEREAQVMGQMGLGGMQAETSAEQALGLAGLDANARAILAQQGGGLNALLAAQQGAIQGNESRLGRANQAAMTGLNALTGSLEASRAAERQQLLGGMDRTSQWNLGTQGNYLQSLLGHDQAALNRMVAESQEQSRGMQDYMTLQREKDAMYNDRLNQMLSLEDRYRTSQNEVYNQMAQYGQLPMQYLMSMVTGISPTGGQGARTNPYGSLVGQLGAAAIGAAPAAYSMWQNQYDPQRPNDIG